MSKVGSIIEKLNANNGEVDLMEMANLEKSESGLPYNIWIDSQGKFRNVPHNSPRIKVDITGNYDTLVPVSIDRVAPVNLSDNPHIKIPKFRKVSKWIIDNYDTLIKHWNKELTDLQALLELRKKS